MVVINLCPRCEQPSYNVSGRLCPSCELADQQPVPDEAKLTDEEVEETWNQCMEDGLIWATSDVSRYVADAATEKAWHVRDDESDAAYNQVCELKMEVAELRTQLDDTNELLSDVASERSDLRDERDAALERVRALVEALNATRRELERIHRQESVYVNETIQNMADAAIASTKEAQDEPQFCCPVYEEHGACVHSV